MWLTAAILLDGILLTEGDDLADETPWSAQKQEALHTKAKAEPELMWIRGAAQFLVSNEKYPQTYLDRVRFPEGD